MANVLGFLAHLRQIGKLIDNGDGSYSEQVAVISGAGRLAIGEWGLGAFAAPTIVGGSLVAPIALAACIATPALAAGTWRMAISIGSTAPAAAGQAAIITRFTAGGAGAQDYLFLPTPTSYYGVHDFVVFSGETIRVRNWIAAGAGQVFSAVISYYQIA